MGIPQELKDIKQWTHSFSIDKLRRPKHSHYTPNGTLPYAQAVAVAKAQRLSFGFYTTFKDPYVIGDIDHVSNPNDPATFPSIQITDLLMNKGLYSEVSPSGEGVRFVCKLPSVGDKEKLRGKIYYTRYPKVDKRECQINIGTPWMRFTGNTTTFSSDSIPVLTLEELDEVFALKYRGTDTEITEDEGAKHLAPSEAKVPTLNEIIAALNNVPLDQSPRIVRAYEKVFQETYSHYNFWLRVMMAVHDYATNVGAKMECLTKVVEWSRLDPVSYEGDEPVIEKWQSLETKEEKVSYHTLMALDYNHRLVWPRPKPLTKKQKDEGVYERQPLNTEYANFKAMIDFYGIRLYRDSNTPAKMYVSGDKDILEKYFHSMDTTYYYEEFRGIFSEKSLANACHIMAQDLGFTGLSLTQTRQFVQSWMYQIHDEIDLVKRYFDTPFEDLPESYQDNKQFVDISTIEYMFGCLTLDHLTKDHTKEEALYFKYYKSWLMGFVRSLYWPNDPHMNNCVLLLTGKEQIRKTSHFRYMLPKFMRDERIAFTTHGFETESAMRDLIKLASGNSLLVWDEIEQYLNAKTESNFKKLIDSNPTKFIDKYETVEAQYKPIAMFGATSNQKEFKLSDTGSRRLFHIPVKWVDTDRLDNVCWWRVVNDLRDEIAQHRGPEPLWLLTQDELEYQSSLHGKITAKSSLEIVIRDIWDYGSDCFIPRGAVELQGHNPLNSPHFVSTSKIIEAINMNTNFTLKINRAQLQRILRNLSGSWTGTRNAPRQFIKPRMVIKQGMATYGGSHKRWVMPKRIIESE
ncbi:MAG: VapE domain-containing protein [Spirochaetaceae bacterium]